MTPLSLLVIFGPAAIGLLLSFAFVGSGNRLIWSAVLPALLLVQLVLIYAASMLIECADSCDGLVAGGLFLSWIPAWLCVIISPFFKQWRKVQLERSKLGATDA
jgi:hypothetical protein